MITMVKNELKGSEDLACRVTCKNLHLGYRFGGYKYRHLFSDDINCCCENVFEPGLGEM